MEARDMSDTPKWTRGPWKIDATTLHFYIFGKPDNVASIIKPIGSPRGTEKALANARLIAAAPEMFEALEKLVGRVERMSSEEWEYTEEVRALARAALAKARGET